MASSRPITRSAPRTGRWSCPRRKRASSTSGRRRSRRRSRDFVAALSRLFRAQQCARRAEEDRTRSVPARRARAGHGIVRSGRIREGRRHRRRHRREHHRSDHGRRSDRPLSADLRSRHVRGGILVAGAGEARQGRGEAAGAAGCGRHRRRLGHRRGDGEGVRARGRGSGRARSRSRRRRRPSRSAIGKTALAIALRRDRAGQTCAPRSTRWAKTFGGVDIVVSNAGAAWQGTIGTVDDAILRQSFELNFFAHQTRGAKRGAGDEGARAPAAACCSTSPSRRSIPARISGPMVCRKPRRCS